MEIQYTYVHVSVKCMLLYKNTQLFVSHFMQHFQAHSTVFMLDRFTHGFIQHFILMLFRMLEL